MSEDSHNHISGVADDLNTNGNLATPPSKPNPAPALDLAFISRLPTPPPESPVALPSARSFSLQQHRALADFDEPDAVTSKQQDSLSIHDDVSSESDQSKASSGQDGAPASSTSLSASSVSAPVTIVAIDPPTGTGDQYPQQVSVRAAPPSPPSPPPEHAASKTSSSSSSTSPAPVAVAAAAAAAATTAASTSKTMNADGANINGSTGVVGPPRPPRPSRNVGSLVATLEPASSSSFGAAASTTSATATAATTASASATASAAAVAVTDSGASAGAAPASKPPAAKKLPLYHSDSDDDSDGEDGKGKGKGKGDADEEDDDVLLDGGGLDLLDDAKVSAIVARREEKGNAVVRKMMKKRAREAERQALRDREEFLDFDPEQELVLKLYAMTWNMYGLPPPPRKELEKFIPSDTFDIYVIGTEECEQSIGMAVLFSSKAKWTAALTELMGPNYVQIGAETMQAIHCIVFARKELAPYIRNMEQQSVPTGIGDFLGNKGGVALSMDIGGTSFLFVNAHFQSGESACERRNQDFHKINSRLTLRAPPLGAPAIAPAYASGSVHPTARPMPPPHPSLGAGRMTTGVSASTFQRNAAAAAATTTMTTTTATTGNAGAGMGRGPALHGSSGASFGSADAATTKALLHHGNNNNSNQQHQGGAQRPASKTVSHGHGHLHGTLSSSLSSPESSSSDAVESKTASSSSSFPSPVNGDSSFVAVSAADEQLPIRQRTISKPGHRASNSRSSSLDAGNNNTNNTNTPSATHSPDNTNSDPSSTDTDADGANAAAAAVADADVDAGAQVEISDAFIRSSTPTPTPSISTSSSSSSFSTAPLLPAPPSHVPLPPALDATARFDCVIWMGDFNYRVKATRHVTELLLRSGMKDELLNNDELREQMRRGNVFRGCVEAPITFPPTYKYDVDSDAFDTSEKRRTPSWTDRIVWKRNASRMLLERYDCCRTVRTSDHRPVFAHFLVRVSRGPSKAPMVEQNCDTICPTQ